MHFPNICCHLKLQTLHSVAPLFVPPHKFTQQPSWYSQLQKLKIYQIEKVFRGMKFITGFMKINQLVSVILMSIVKKVEFVSDRMSYIILRGRWCDIIILNVHAQQKIELMK
jgi:hypothetical protein